MRRILVIACVVALAAATAPAGAGGKMKRLGEDAAGDGPPALDLAYLDVGRRGPDLVVRIGVNNMIPPTGGYPEVPALEWVFELRGRTFLAEAVAGRNPRFFLFELKGDVANQMDAPQGTYEWTDGFAEIQIPLKGIGARKGTVISGVDPFEVGGDVDAHVHHAGTDYIDWFETTKDFVVP